MNAAEVADLLNRLGVGMDESAIYVQLSIQGPSKAGDLARATRLSRPRTYRALERLAEKSMVSTGLGRPRLFQAAEPATLFKHVRQEAEARYEVINAIEPKVTLALTGGTLRGGPGGGPHMETIRGRDAVMRLASELARRAQQEVAWLFTAPGGLPALEPTEALASIVQTAQKGVRVRLMVRRHPADERLVEERLNLKTIKVRHVEAEEVALCQVIDRREALVLLVSDDNASRRNDQTVALWTSAPDFVATMCMLFEGMWKDARDLPFTNGVPKEKKRPQLAPA